MSPRFPPARRSLQRLCCAGAILAALGAYAHEDRLIDDSLERPPLRSPDWAESSTARTAPSAPQAFGPIVPATRQPAGALSGRIVFMNGGHGWTFDPDYWRLQRGNFHEMNEDYGNLDQLNLFAAYCFKAGAVIVPMRPLGQQTNEAVLDNDSPAVTYLGAWSESTSPIFYGSPGDVPYRFAALASTETATATYTPTVPTAGFIPSTHGCGTARIGATSFTASGIRAGNRRCAFPITSSAMAGFISASITSARARTRRPARW